MSTSLDLLKGKQAASSTPETPAKAAPKLAEAKSTTKSKKAPVEETVVQATEEAGQTVEVDPDSMNSAQLDALVAEHGIEVPNEWLSWDADGKRTWLKEQFEDRDEIADGIVATDEAGNTDVGVQVETEEAGQAHSPDADPPFEEDQPKEPATAVSTALGEGKAKPKKTTPAKTSAAAKASLSGEVLPPSELSDLVHDIENLVEKDAKEMASKLADASDFMIFQLGGVLSVIQANGWFSPYANLKEYVEKAHGILYRKAVYYIKIYNGLVESKVPWSEVKHLGWTKLKELADLMTLDNYKDWVKIAEEQTTLQLIDTIDKHKKSQAGTLAISDQTSTTVTTKTFKVHEDQKDIIEAALDKAKTEGATSVDTVALTYICQEYVAGPAKLTLKQRLTQAGIEAALEAISEAFPTYDFNVLAPSDE